jgi:hypothetical protein
MRTLPATVSSKAVRVLPGEATRSTNFREVGGAHQRADFMPETCVSVTTLRDDQRVRRL